MSDVILGISGGLKDTHHDSAAAIFLDNKLVGAEEEERNIRYKGAPGLLPEQAITNLIRSHQIDPRNIDKVVFSRSTVKNASYRLKDWLNFRFNIDAKVELVDHHQSHAASAYHFSPYSRCLTFTFDLSGDKKSGSVTVINGTDVKVVKEFKRPNSFGLLYALFTQFLGFRYNRDEFKMMALAAYGRSNYDLSDFLQVTEGDLVLNRKILNPEYSTNNSPRLQERLWSDWFAEKIKCSPRKKNEPLDQNYFDLAASIQVLLETKICQIIEHYCKAYDIGNVCLSGGIALNCKMNQVIGDLEVVDNLFVPPWPSDSGTAIGGPLLVKGNSFTNENYQSSLSYLGTSYKDEDIYKLLNQLNVKFEKPNDIAMKTAIAICNGNTIGWFQGKMEFGPRALGNRSIVGDALDNTLYRKISFDIKGRESFRPLAPAILYDEAKKYFEIECESPFMSRAVKSKNKDLTASVCHIDVTSRIQTVNESSKFSKLLSEVSSIRNTCVLINTSFNVRGMPIVQSPIDAISAYFSSNLDCLALGNFWLKKK